MAHPKLEYDAHATKPTQLQIETQSRCGDMRRGPGVSSYALSFDDRFVLIDPVIPQDGLDDLLAGREAVIVLTCPWHARDGLKLHVPLFAPPPDPRSGP